MLYLLTFFLSSVGALFFGNIFTFMGSIFIIFILQLFIVLLKELETGIEKEWKKLLSNTYNLMVFKVFLTIFLILSFGGIFFHYLFRSMHIPHLI